MEEEETETVCEPKVFFDPPQSPEAVQEVALVEVQMRLVVPGPVRVLGIADSVTVGAGVVGGAVVTVTEALAESLPPAPLQVRV